MTVVVDPPATGRPDRGWLRRGWLRRGWNAPLWAHVAALGLLLTALLAVVGTHASFSADEGAVIIQARSLARGDGWIVEHPVPQADPDGANYPLELSSKGPEGVAPFAKHPVYALVLAGMERLGGIRAMVGLSLVGTLVAAGVAAALASRIGGPGLARPALWGVGLGTPLFFDGYLVIAHTVGAALAGAAVLTAAVAVDRRRPVLALAVAPLAGLAVLFRTEALLYSLALAVVAGVLALRRTGSTRVVAAVVAAASAGGAAAAALAERSWAAAIVGGTPLSTGGGPPAGDGFLADRFHAFVLTWLRPTYDGGPVDVALVVMAVAAVLAVIVAGRHPGDDGPVRLLAGAAAVASVLAVVAGRGAVVPGLLVACPLVAAGLFAFRRADLGAGPHATLAAGTCAGFAVAVLATQYSTGGSGEWGGRYFALGLPVVVPLCLVALRRVGERLNHATQRVGAAAMVVCSVSLAALAIGGLRDTHQFTGRLVAAIDRTARTVAPSATGDDRPVILTTEPAIPRSAWATFHRQRWMLARSDDLSGVVDRLRAAGVDRVTLVSTRPPEGLTRQLGPGVTQVSADGWAESVGWRVLVLQLG
jgi:hypothetical protein